MELVACIKQWVQEAIDFGRATWGDAAVVPAEVPGDSLPMFVNAVGEGRAYVKVFSGTITQVETMPDGVVWVTVTRGDGEEDEFEGLGGAVHYRVGRSMTVREFIFPPVEGGRRPSTYPAEIWIGGH